ATCARYPEVEPLEEVGRPVLGDAQADGAGLGGVPGGLDDFDVAGIEPAGNLDHDSSSADGAVTVVVRPAGEKPATRFRRQGTLRACRSRPAGARNDVADHQP